MLLLHGFGADLNVWRRWLNHFAAGRGALALDLPGHGRSSLVEPLTDRGVRGRHGRDAAAGGRRLRPCRRPFARRFGGGGACGAGARPRRLADAGRPGGPGARHQRRLHSRLPRRALAREPEALARGTVAGPGRARRRAAPRRRCASAATSASARLRRRSPRRCCRTGRRSIPRGAALAAYPGPVKLIFGREDRILPVRHARGLPGAAAVHILPGRRPHAAPGGSQSRSATGARQRRRGRRTTRDAADIVLVQQLFHDYATSSGMQGAARACFDTSFTHISGNNGRPPPL